MKNDAYRPLKRTIDIIGATTALIIFSPLILLAAILVKLSSKGPIIFTQKRVGVNGKEFVFYKFRSMYIGDNDERLKKYPALWEKYKKSDCNFKQKINISSNYKPYNINVERAGNNDAPEHKYQTYLSKTLEKFNSKQGISSPFQHFVILKLPTKN